MNGFTIVSPYNPNLVVFDGRHLSYEDCCAVASIYEDARKTTVEKDLLLAEAREKNSNLIQKHDKLRADYIAELCKCKYELREKKKFIVELVTTIEGMESEKANFIEALNEKEVALAGSKRKFAQLEDEKKRDRLEYEGYILNRQQTIDCMEENKLLLEERITSLQNLNKDKEREAKQCIIS